MKELCDVVIIGAGLGGLAAAAYLTKAGLRVLIFERNPHVGGTAYVYHRKGFTFPMGPLGFSHPLLVQRVLKELGVGEDLEFSRIHYRLRAFDLDMPLSLPFSDMVKTLGELFPGDEEGVSRFFSDASDWISKSKSDGKRFESCRRDHLSASDYLQERVRDRRLRRILGSLGTREPYSGLPLLRAMWNLMSREGIWFPREGMRSFCDRMAQAVVKKEGAQSEIRLSKGVETIRVDHGKVLGVILEDQTVIDAPFVISNGDYKSTFLKLLDSRSVSSRWHRAVSQARQTGSIFQVCLGVDRHKVDLSAFKEASRVIYRRGDKRGDRGIEERKNLDWEKSQIDPEELGEQEIEVSLWGENWDEILSGKSVSLVLRVEADFGHFSRFWQGWRRRSSEYTDYKVRLAQGLIREVGSWLPGLEKAIRVMDVATPLTVQDQGGRSGGAVAGWSWDYEDFQEDEPKDLILTPVRGLYMAGYQAFSALFMGGVPTALESGKRAADAVLRGAEPTEEISIPGVSDA